MVPPNIRDGSINNTDSPQGQPDPATPGPSNESSNTQPDGSNQSYAPGPSRKRMRVVQRSNSGDSIPEKRARRTVVQRKQKRYTTFAQVVRQLNEIRLLIINPAKNNSDPLYCELASSTNEPNPPCSYEALSYMWGTDAATEQIKIFYPVLSGVFSPDKTGRKRSFKTTFWAKFYVRPNLHVALRHLRHHKKKTVLWVDALCIEQENIQEKNDQVKKMAEIYNRATNVCIWLGEGNLQSQLALDFIPKLLEGANLDKFLQDESSSGHWFALAELMRNQWFSRRWVVQEVALATEATLHCGNERVDWGDFADAVALFVDKFDTVNNLARNSQQFRNTTNPLGNVRTGAHVLVETINNLFRKSANGDIERLSTLEILVSTLLSFESSDPRDTVYAVLSMAKDTIQGDPSNALRESAPHLIPDYDKPIIEVFKEFVDFVVSSSESLDIICRHWAPDPKKRGPTPGRKQRATDLIQREYFPSWMPLVSRSAYGTPIQRLEGRWNGDSFVGTSERKNYDASPKTSAIWRFRQTLEPLGPILGRRNTPSGEFVNFNKEASPQSKSRQVASRFSNKNSNSPTRYQRGTGPPTERPTPSSTPLIPNNDTNGHSSSNHVTDAQGNSSQRSNYLPSAISQPTGPNSQALTNIQPTISLFVKGFRLDVIKDLGTRVAQGVIPRECLELGGWFGPDYDDYIDIPQVPDELWRTMVADRGPDGGNPPPFYQRACQKTLAQSTKGDIEINKLILAGEDQMMVDFLKRVQSVIWNRKFLRSASMKYDGPRGKLVPKKLFGLAPDLARVGDVICILLGCSVPVILRKHDTHSNRRCELIGEAYIYGMMAGEALGGRKMQELREGCEEFELC